MKYLSVAVGYFGDRDIQTIEPSDVLAWLNWLRDTKKGRKASGLSGATRRHYFFALSGMFGHAAFLGLLPKGNPAARVPKKRRPKMDTARQAWLAPHDAALYLEAARLLRHRAGVDSTYPLMYALVATFMLTGGRKNEVLGLAVNDVDFDAGEVHLRPHPWRRLKNDGSIRALTLWPQLRDVLREYLSGPVVGPSIDEQLPTQIERRYDKFMRFNYYRFVNAPVQTYFNHIVNNIANSPGSLETQHRAFMDAG